MADSNHRSRNACIAIAALRRARARWRGPARADLQLCSRMSYVVEAAIAIEDKGAAATRGWFRIDPGQCRTVLQGALPGRDASTSMPARCRSTAARRCRSAGDADFCVAHRQFRAGRRAQLQPRRPDARPLHRGQADARPRRGSTAYLAEEAEYTDEQARDAGIQRLLVIAGYDANPIDGIRGAKTDAALAQFIADNKLDKHRGRPRGLLRRADRRRAEAGRRGLRLVQRHPPCRDGGARRRGQGHGRHPRLVPRRARQVPAARSAAASRAGSTASARRSAPTASRSSADRTGRLGSWGGATILCTRNVKFELSDHQDCAGKGLTATGFASVELTGDARHHGAVQVKSAARSCGAGARRSHVDRSMSMQASAKPAPRGFAAVETWVFDLDNTLYPHHLNLWQQIDERIRDVRVATSSSVTHEEAFRVQKDYYKRYGTTMRGLMTEHGAQARRLPRLRAPDRPFAAAAQPGAGRGDREAARPQAHPHQRHPQARRRGDAAARHPPAFRGRVRHRRRRPRSQAAAAGLRPLPRTSTASIRARPPCSRIWRATSKCRTRSA